ncbi:Pao retrotransposon peptidase [Nesidiocoris tenuis]|uniref:Pao retrotransposon peptidase n=1 Tax=Nesidiocoris tenuis TaxID=355587 RepID=A0ABN7B1T7_9HEMI|nr:Pao retrotransposon peptidase [Nesidiocoris tenuis]
MSPVSPPTCGQKVYYLPHHAVFRQDNPTSKIRVVFNGSQRTTTGYSLNDILHTGPKLLPNILEIVTRFRQHLYVFTGDIKQMFRNINIVPHERDLLRILWRSDPNLPIQDYCLNTVTYGTTSAPYLANKVIQSLAKIGRETHPLASEILANRTYVDDCHGGGRTIEEALKARKDIVSLLSSGGFELRKWAANHPDILSQLPREHLLPAHSSVEFSTEEEKSLKILGLLWNPSADNFHYVSSPVPDIRTKRDLASQIGRIFDPLGWLMPVAVQARSIQRSVCLAKYDWDENLSFDLQAQWKVFASDFNNLPKITIPRLMSFSEDRDWLVGFADASERAYAAVVYHVNCSSSPPTVRLVLARARMAPIKQESLPRLELLAAELLSKMFSKVSPIFPHVSIDQQIAFSDSTIALSWITANPAPLWKVFVGNRVAKILDNLPADRWFHVRSSENPADLASRGALPSQIAQSSLWWTGPSWLSSPQIEWPCKKVSADLNDPLVDAERRAKCPLLCATVAQIDDFQLEQKFSNWSTLRRVVAWSLRFAYNCTHPSEKHSGALEAGELQNAEDCLIRRTQQHFLKDQLKDVQSHKPKDRLTKTLGLFIDPKGILRVGGRLSNADLPFQAQHPALLPKDSHLTKIIIASAHEQLLHVGPRTTLAWLRQKYWVMNGRNVVQRQLANCIRCFSVNPRPYQPEMGQLPRDRTLSIAPFQQVGIDYAGPFNVNFTGHRGTKTHFVYLAIFVCFSTKAIHLEVVMDLSTDGFLQALERFVGRRGVPAVIHTDNGRNFVGAANLLRPVRQCFDTAEHRAALINQTSDRGIQWKFIPPRAPHFGGLWEAAVKSTKRLLKVTLLGHTPSFQVFSTLIVRVEAILNSRPLAADLSSPNELRVITPGHFLAQRPLTSLPEPSNQSRHSFLSTWRFVQQSTATFWKRWQREYLLEQQQMLKWNTPSKPPRIGQVVLIREDNVPPLQWPLGVITELVPGQDQKTRVAILRTSAGVKTRPIIRLCPLPDDSTQGTPRAGQDVQPSS